MAESQRRLILANGENLVGVIPKPGGGGPTPLPRTYDEARERVVSQLTASLGKAISLPPTQKYPDEMVLCLRLHPDMLAKSYDPASIFIEVPGLRNVGSRNWTTKSADVAQTERIKKQRQKGASQTLGRLLFVQGGEAGFRRLLRTLDLSPRVLRKQFMEDIQKIESFDLLTPEERILGFDSNWQKGRVELALHPTQNGSELQRDFFGMLFKQLEISKSQIRSAFYGDGSAFASVFITREALKQLGDCNPLRTAHPLLFSEPVDLRSVSMLNAPAPPNSTTVSTIKLGIFDGGIDENSPLLKGHAQEDIALSIKTPRDPKYVAHGTAVATGSSNWVARVTNRERTTRDSLIAFWAILDSPIESRLLFMEPSDYGWWYICPDNSGRAVACLVTDFQSARQDSVSNAENWTALLQNTELFRNLKLKGGFCRIEATTLGFSFLRERTGNAWTAVGDAAIKLDPLGSSGLMMALDSGRRAANAIADNFAGDGRGLVRYSDWGERLITKFDRQRRQQYALEKQRRPSGFWSRRISETTGQFENKVQTAGGSALAVF